MEKFRSCLCEEEPPTAIVHGFDTTITTLLALTPEQLRATFTVGWKGHPEADGRASVMKMFVHVAHHRARCEAYLRLKGIRPPGYTF